MRNKLIQVFFFPSEVSRRGINNFCWLKNFAFLCHGHALSWQDFERHFSLYTLMLRFSWHLSLNINVYRENCFSKSCHKSACPWHRKAKLSSKKDYCSLSWIPLREQKLLGLVCFSQVRLRGSTLRYIHKDGLIIREWQNTVSSWDVHPL